MVFRRRHDWLSSHCVLSGYALKRSHSSSAYCYKRYRPSILMFYTTVPKHEARPHSIARCGTWTRNGPDGRRPRPSFCRDSRRWSDSGAVLHALDHTFLRARVRVFRRHVGLAPSRDATRDPRALAFPVTAWLVARFPRAHREIGRAHV